ncbi:MAG: neutral/alkaline non-lysosomal ceramidase N-terminal domain-containing protein [Planctomycetota bacterium]
MTANNDSTRVRSRGKTRWALLLIAFHLASNQIHANADDLVPVGFATRDITPERPLRLSGYGSRSEVMTGVRDRLFVRAMSIGDGERLCVMVSVEGIAVLAEQTERLLEVIAPSHSLDRSRLVVCSTHSHAAPQMAGGLTNLFRVPTTNEQMIALEEYRDFVHEQCLAAINESIANRHPSTISIGNGRADFAVHRRVIKDGTWTGFGVSSDGPTDRRVRMLVVRDADGSLSGAVFQYACHCTTLGPSFNEVTGDWAGIAAAELEARHSGTTFMPVIGCGADANPEPRDDYQSALKHGKEMAEAVDSVISGGSLQPLNSVPRSRFGYAGLTAESPSREQLTEFLEDSNVNRARWARNMLDIWKSKGRLPESYPAPIHTWTFGDQLAWVFLGGEVVVQYQMRLEQELGSFDEVWVAAYTDDVFAYVAAEDMRSAGGYEVDFSMVYYDQPGRWQSGTENLIVRRVHEILASEEQGEGAKSPQESLRCMQVPDGFRIELVANEPIISDPVNLAFAGDGSVWIVEMGDYPLGKNGGRVKRLLDTDFDGKLDTAELFLDGLEFPTSVLPWRDGAIVIAAPDIFFARDTDGDGQADERETLLTGIGHANPQHRASGFDWGLDGMVYFGAGETDNLRLPGTKGMEVHGSDLRWNPDSGEFERLPGDTQFIRSRDRWGRWFGNSNSLPLFHYSIDRYDILSRNPSVSKRQLVLRPGVAPPVYPRSRTVDRFNDLFAKNRFTSACSSIVLRGTGLGNDMLDTALVCEPVHNLVARFKLEDEGPYIIGKRFEDDQPSDFITSTDTWSRPVRAVEAPDGSLWVVDMYRSVIEHPQWIPDAWQKRLNLRAGENAGRIYRICKSDADVWRPIDLQSLDITELIETLKSPNGILRDLACQRLLWHQPSNLREQVVPLLASSDAAVRLQSFGLLCAAGCETEIDWRRMLGDSEPRIVARVIRLASDDGKSYKAPLLDFYRKARPDNQFIQLALLVSLVNTETNATDEPTRRLVAKLAATSWARDAMSLASKQKAPIVLSELLDWLAPRDSITPQDWQELQTCIEKLWKASDVKTRQATLDDALSDIASELTSVQWMVMLVAARDDALAADRSALAQAAIQVREKLTDKNASLDLRLRATQLFGSSLLPVSNQLDDLRAMLSPDQPGAIRKAALATAYRIQADETASILLSAWRELVPDERRTAGTTLLQRLDWTRRLVGALEQGDIAISDVDASTLNELQNYQNYSIMKRLGTLIAKPSPSERSSLVEHYTTEVDKRVGDASTGRQLFADHCAVCHRSSTSPSGELALSIGPEIANLKKWSTSQWVTAVLDPNATIEAKYKRYNVLTRSGQIFSGVVQEQSDLNLKIGQSDGKIVDIARSDIEELSDARVSMMPEGLESRLTPNDLSNIIAFLRAE